MAGLATGGETGADAGSALGGIEREGLKRLDAGLVQTITQARNLGDVFHEVALGILGDLAKIAIERTLIQPLSSALLSPARSGGGASAGAGLFSGVGDVLGFATGGRIAGSGSATSDSILARVSSGEFVMPAAATAANLPLLEAIRSGLPRFAAGGVVGASSPQASDFAARQSGASAGDGRSGPVFDLRGALVTADLLRQVNDKVAAGTAQAVGISVQHTNATVASAQRASAGAARRDLTRY